VRAEVTPFGDGALLVEVDDVAAAHRLAHRLEVERAGGAAPAALGESVVGFGNVVVHLEPGRERPEVVEAWLDELTRRIPDRSGDPARGAAGQVVIPVSFDGPDLGAVAVGLGTTPRAVVEALTGATLEVAFVGFSPGFPYLVGLPTALASVPRRDTPRPSVPAGSVAVGGGFASVYPQSTPGGWMVLGRTSLRLFDPHRPPYALLRAGDTIRFTAEPGSRVPAGATARAPDPVGTTTDGPGGVRRPLLVNRGDRFAEILEPGALSLVEDQGRRSVAGQGVPRAGPADPEAMRLANRLAGNPDDAAAVEVTAAGPSLRFTGDAHVTVVGVGLEAVDVLVDGRGVGSGTVVPVVDGQVVSVGRVRAGLRAYLAVAGGFDIPLAVGSRASDMLCGLGPGPLRAGDRLGLGPPGRPLGLLSPPGIAFGSGRRPVLRVLPGPHRVSPDRWRRLLSGPWTVGAASNRVGLRLESTADRPERPPATGPAPAAIPSTGMVTGAVQIPPDGNPIVLMPDHATVGGYPVACCVISADLPVLGQLRPGDTVEFTPVDRGEALEARDRWERSMAERVSGWFPTAVGT